MRFKSSHTAPPPEFRREEDERDGPTRRNGTYLKLQLDPPGGKAPPSLDPHTERSKCQKTALVYYF